MAIMQPQHVGSVLETEPFSERSLYTPDLPVTAEYLESLRTLKDGSELSLVKHLETDKIKEGYIERYGLVTKAGFTYDAIVGIPKHQSSYIPVFGTGAWFTSTRGHNEHFLRHLMRSGLPIIFVGAEGSYRPKDLAMPKHIPSLAGSAAATLSVSQELAGQHHHLFDRSKRILIGESRGAMVGMGIQALDGLYDQEVVYADLTAPCFPKGVQLGDVVNLARNVYQEPVAFFKSLAGLTLRQAMHDLATVDLHPYSLLHQGLIGSSLFSGEAGDLAHLIPKDKIMHITCFDDDISSMREEWKNIFAEYPNVRLTPLEGSHLTIADPQTQAYIEARIIAFLTLYNQNSANVNSHILFNAAHWLVKNIEVAN